MRISPSVRAVQQFVEDHPGCSKFQAALHLASKEIAKDKMKFGSRSVARAVEAKVIVEKDSGLYLNQEGSNE